MAHSFVTLHGRDVRLNDSDLIAVIHIVIDEANKRLAYGKMEPWLATLLKEWRESVLYDGAGCIDLKLDEYLISTERLELVLELLDAATERIRGFDPVVPQSYLRSIIRISGIESGDYSSHYLLGAVSEIRELILGEGRRGQP